MAARFGYTHGIMVVDVFYENVGKAKMERRTLADGEEEENVILEFRPRTGQQMLVARLWSKWTAPGEPGRLSFAAIADDPPPDVAAAGCDRRIITIKWTMSRCDSSKAYDVNSLPSLLTSRFLSNAARSRLLWSPRFVDIGLACGRVASETGHERRRSSQVPLRMSPTHTASRSALIEARRLDVTEILDDSPSLRAKVDEPRTFQLIWADALAQATAESGHDWSPSECPWAIDDVLSEGWLPADASKLRHVDLRALALNIDATYIRVSGKSGARIRYQRINFGRPTQGRKAKAGAIVSRMALTICMLAPDVVDTILTMPSGTLGRVVKAEVRRARTPKHTRELVKRRPVSTVFRVPELAPT